MKQRYLLVWVPVLALIVPLAFACSSNDSTGGNKSDGGSGTGGSGGSGGSAGGGTGGSAGTSSGKCVTEEAALNACYTDSSTTTVQDLAKQCGIDCVLTPDAGDKDQCTLDCLLAETANAISVGCAGCVVGSVSCGRDNCLGPCLGTDEAACNTCLCGGGSNTNHRNCIQEYIDCSGRSNTTCTTGGQTHCCGANCPDQ